MKKIWIIVVLALLGLMLAERSRRKNVGSQAVVKTSAEKELATTKKTPLPGSQPTATAVGKSDGKQPPQSFSLEPKPGVKDPPATFGLAAKGKLFKSDAET